MNARRWGIFENRRESSGIFGNLRETKPPLDFLTPVHALLEIGVGGEAGPEELSSPISRETDPLCPAFRTGLLIACVRACVRVAWPSCPTFIHSSHPHPLSCARSARPLCACARAMACAGGGRGGGFYRVLGNGEHARDLQCGGDEDDGGPEGVVDTLQPAVQDRRCLSERAGECGGELVGRAEELA